MNMQSVKSPTSSYQEHFRKHGFCTMNIGAISDSMLLNRISPLVLEATGIEGKVIPQQNGGLIENIQPTKQKLSLADSQGSAPITGHTDDPHEGIPARILALHCQKPDQLGKVWTGVTDFKSLLESYLGLTLEEKKLMTSSKYKWMSKDGQQSIYRPIWDPDFPTDTGCGLLRFSANILLHGHPSPSIEMKRGNHNQDFELQRLCQRIEELCTTFAYEIDLPRGGLLLIDNHRCLHFRSQVFDPNRLLKRIWLR